MGMRKSKTKSAAMRRADKYFSMFVRLRDSDENGTGACACCGKLVYWRNGHAGHFVLRGRHSTRFDERNVNLSCVRCNLFLSGNTWEHGQYIDALHGKGTALKLKRKGEEIHKFTRDQLDIIAYKYRTLAEEMLAEKGGE